MKKYPLSFIFTFEMITLFGGIVLWRFLDYFDIINDKLSPILGGILGVFGFLGLFFIFKFWNEFYQSGKISDYLNYVNSSEHTARSQSAFGGSRYSDEMEKMQDAGKSDRNGAFGDSRGGIR